MVIGVSQAERKGAKSESKHTLTIRHIDVKSEADAAPAFYAGTPRWLPDLSPVVRVSMSDIFLSLLLSPAVNPIRCTLDIAQLYTFANVRERDSYSTVLPRACDMCESHELRVMACRGILQDLAPCPRDFMGDVAVGGVGRAVEGE